MRWNMTVCSEGLQLRAGDDTCDTPSPNCLQENDCEPGKFELQRKLNHAKLRYCYNRRFIAVTIQKIRYLEKLFC